MCDLCVVYRNACLSWEYGENEKEIIKEENTMWRSLWHLKPTIWNRRRRRHRIEWKYFCLISLFFFLSIIFFPFSARLFLPQAGGCEHHCLLFNFSLFYSSSFERYTFKIFRHREHMLHFSFSQLNMIKLIPLLFFGFLSCGEKLFLWSASEMEGKERKKKKSNFSFLSFFFLELSSSTFIYWINLISRKKEI